MAEEAKSETKPEAKVETPPTSTAAPAPTSDEKTLFPEGGEPKVEASSQKSPEAEPDKPAGATADDGGGETKEAEESVEPAEAMGKKEGEPAKVEAVDPTTYDFKFPEGYTEDETLIETARTIFSEAGVPIDKAQSLIDLYVGTQKVAQTASDTEFATKQKEWQTEINTFYDSQGMTKKNSLTEIGRVLDEYGPEFREVLGDKNVGNHPATVKFMHNISQALGEGSPVPSGGAVDPAKAKRGIRQTDAQVLFPGDGATPQ